MYKLIGLTLTLCFSFASYADYGFGKLIKVKDEKLSAQYILLVKDGEKLGALPIVETKQVNKKHLNPLVDEYVIFVGKVIKDQLTTIEGSMNAELIELSEIKAFEMKSLQLADSDVKAVKTDSRQAVNKPRTIRKRTIRLDDHTAQSAILTGSLLMAHSAGTAGQAKPARELGQMLIIGSGLVMMAGKLKNMYKIEDSHWEIPMND
jgi:hypothetical protein